jgi:hypothetical protein
MSSSRGQSMKLVPVQSRGIAAAGYDARARILRVRYIKGHTYDYLDVPPNKHAAFNMAESKGRFVNYQIKPFHRFRRLGRPLRP